MLKLDPAGCESKGSCGLRVIVVSQSYFVSQSRGIRLSCIEQDRHWMVNAYIHVMGQVGAYYRTKGQLLEERKVSLPGARRDHPSTV